MLVDHSTSVPVSVMIKFPSLARVSAPPDGFVTGFSRFATHKIVSNFLEKLRYHTPMYRRLDFSGVKNPSSKMSPFDTSVSPSRRDSPMVRVSFPWHGRERGDKMIKIEDRRDMVMERRDFISQKTEYCSEMLSEECFYSLHSFGKLNTNCYQLLYVHCVHLFLHGSCFYAPLIWPFFHSRKFVVQLIVTHTHDMRACVHMHTPF